MASQNDANEHAEFYISEEEEENFYQLSGKYFVYKCVRLPQPECRKYHISTNVNCAQAIARIVLPHLRQHNAYHKVVLNKYWLIEQTAGSIRDQAGKFITIYMEATAGRINAVVGGLYKALQKAEGISPCTIWPRRRHGSTHGEFEQPVYRNRQGVFIWGGFICDPRA